MKIVTTYIAFDDMEFDTEKECLEYENQARAYIAEIMRCYTFYNKNMEMMSYSCSDDIIEALDYIGNMYNDCEFIKVHEMPNREAHNFFRYCEGIILPEKIGTFKYDNGEWV